MESLMVGRPLSPIRPYSWTPAWAARRQSARIASGTVRSCANPVTTWWRARATATPPSVPAKATEAQPTGDRGVVKSSHPAYFGSNVRTRFAMRPGFADSTLWAATPMVKAWPRMISESFMMSPLLNEYCMREAITSRAGRSWEIEGPGGGRRAPPEGYDASGRLA